MNNALCSSQTGSAVVRLNEASIVAVPDADALSENVFETLYRSVDPIGRAGASVTYVERTLADLLLLEHLSR